MDPRDSKLANRDVLRRGMFAAVIVCALAAPALAHALSVSIARASVSSAGAQANQESGSPAVNGGGSVVVFESGASNLVAGDTNGVCDIFVRSVATGAVRRASVTGEGAQANGVSQGPSVSADGRYVAFESYASNLVAGDTNGTWDVFVKDMTTGLVRRVSTTADDAQVPANSYSAAISPNGRYVAFESDAANLVPGDGNGRIDVYVKDLSTGAVVLASASASGAAGDEGSFAPSVSSTGRVAFESDSTNLVTGDTNAVRDIFFKDVTTGAISCASVSAAGAQGAKSSHHPSISADGRYVAFDSDTVDLVTGDANSTVDVFVKDTSTGAVKRASADSAGADSAGGFSPSLSADGRWVAFQSVAATLVAGDTNGKTDVFAKDLTTGAIVRMSVSGAGAQGDGDSIAPAISGDGMSVAFESYSTNLVAGDTNSLKDVFAASRAVAKPAATIGAPYVSSSTARPSVAFSVSGVLKPYHPSTYYVTVRAYQSAGASYVYKKSFKATVSRYSTYSRYTCKVALPRGNWKLKAVAPADTAHSQGVSGFSRVVTVR